MRIIERNLAVLSVALMCPAILLFTAGLLYLAFGWEDANKFLENLMATSAGRILLSPMFVLGGLAVVIGLNLWRVCHLSAELIHDELVIALSVKRALGPLTCLASAGGLIALLFAYAFAENFVVIPR